MKIQFCKKWLVASALLALGAVVIMLYTALTAEHTHQAYAFSEPLVKVSLQGRFRIGHGPWQTYPPENMNLLRAPGREKLEFSGHFTPGIPKGRTVLVYVRHVHARLAVNGTTVFDLGGKGSTPPFTRTPGSLWASFISPGISPDEAITITVQRTASDVRPAQLEAFLTNIHYGSVWKLLLAEIEKVWWGVPLAAIFVTMSLLLAILALLFMRRKEAKFATQALYLAGIYFSVGLWAMINYKILSLVLPFPLLIMTWEAFSFIFATAFIVLYVSTLLTGIRRCLALYAASLLFCVLVVNVVMQLTGHAELFVIQNYLHIFSLCTVVACICFAFMERKTAEKESVWGFMTFIPLCMLGFLDIVVNMFGNITNGLFACFGFLITAALQFFLLVNAASRKMQQASRLEREVVESRIAVSLSQIRPHFLYNVLTGIQYLCAEDPAKAEKAITDFTVFLRGNLDALSRVAPILLGQELEHVRHYLALEQLRYGDKLRVEWDLTPMEILVPALSVQPLAENAVRWGMRESGLTVRIATRTTDQGHVITVEDDGAGFDPHIQQPKRGTGIGLASIRTRVGELYGGELRVNSAPGKGTVSTLIFPPTVHRSFS